MLKLVAIFVFCCFINGCATRVLEAKLGVNADMSSAAKFIVSAKIENIGRIVKEARSCGAKARTLPGRDTKFAKAEIIADFPSPIYIENGINCGDFGQNIPTVKLWVEDGIFRDKYSVEISYRHSAINLFSQGDIDEMYISLPGGTPEIENITKIPLYKFLVKSTGDGSFLVRKEKTAYFEEYKEKYWKALGQWDKDCKALGSATDGEECYLLLSKNYIDIASPKIHFKVSSYLSKFSLDSVLAILGIILGSGLTLGLINKLTRQFKRTRKART